MQWPKQAAMQLDIAAPLVLLHQRMELPTCVVLQQGKQR